MKSGMEAEGHQSPTPIQTEDPNIVGFSLADPAITTTERRLALGQGTIDTRPPSFAYGDEEPISLENVPVFTSTLEHTLIAPPEVIRRIEEAKRAVNV